MDLTERFETKTLVGYSILAMLVLAILVTTIVSWGGFPIWYWFLLVVLLSVVIWAACEPFSEASFFLGKNIPGSVRGATIDAIASSMPEFFTVIFFLVIFRKMDTGSGTGFSSGIATCAGSAIYNMIVIPAICVFFVYNYRKLKGLDTDLVVEKEVLYRDGLYFLFSEIVLISFISQGELTWWMGATFLGLYAGYAFWLWLDAKRHMRHLKVDEKKGIDLLSRKLHIAINQKNKKKLEQIWPDIRESDLGEDLDEDPEEFWNGLKDHMPDLTRAMDKKRQNECSIILRAQGADEFTVDYLGGKKPGMLRLNVEEKEDGWQIGDAIKYDHTKKLAWMTIAITTVLVAGACYFLALSCERISFNLGVQPFFVAVIIAAAATSVPDTFLSMLSARKGDDSGAVSNAFGSNIFDINIGLGLPLLIWTIMDGPLEIGGTGVKEVRIVLLILSTLTLIIFAVKMKLNRLKAIILFFLYALFMLYAFLRGWFGMSVSEIVGIVGL